MELEVVVLSFALGLLTSLYGATVGGSGLIVIPVLIFFGLPSQQAVATALVGYLGMCTVGLATFHRAEKVDFRIAMPMALLALAGAVVGTAIFVRMESVFLEKLIGIFILLVLLIVLIKPQYGVRPRALSSTWRMLGYAFFFPLGVYAVVVAAGGSIFVTYVTIFCFGQTFLESAGARKLIFLGTNLVGVVLYSSYGFIQWPIGIALFCGMALGTYLAITHALQKGDEFVRWLFIPVVIISALKLLL